MASSNILSETLSAITEIKLEELSSQQAHFEEGKKDLLKSVDAETNQTEKVRILLNQVDKLASMGKFTGSSITNIRKFIEQARHDPSVSESLQKDWETRLKRDLDIHSVKYEYATLYGKLVNEWLSKSSETSTPAESRKIGGKEMHEQRNTWKNYVFTAKQTDTAAITSYLEKLFGSSEEVQDTYNKLCINTSAFEKEFIEKTHFDENSLRWVIEGLLRSDLVSDEKRKLLKDILNNKVVLEEVCDVLNMRMGCLEKWEWDRRGTLVEQRRQINGRYRFYNDEDLLQTILLRFIGVKWSVFLKRELKSFLNTSAGWKPSTQPIPHKDKIRRAHFVGYEQACFSVEKERDELFRGDIFLSQLQDQENEVRGGYEDDSGQTKADTRQSPQKITQHLLHVLATEIILKTHLGHDICVVRSDFKWFGPSLPHSTVLAVLKFFNVSDRWVDFFRRALEAPTKFADEPIQVRKRGTPISGPLSDMLGETILFVLDFAFNQLTQGARLYRLHDDIWFWGEENTCIKGWEVMTEFTKIMGLEINNDKTGSVRIARKGEKVAPVLSKLPKGEVRWGFLKLDAATGRFLIDQNNVDKHIEELRCQLAACKSIFDWIQAWNNYGSRFFAVNFGKPAHCYGITHVDMMLDTFSRIQNKLFASTGGSVTSTLKQMISERFGVKDIPEGYLYFPMSKGGLDLKSPFIDLYLIRDEFLETPDCTMDLFLKSEEAVYNAKKKAYENNGMLCMSNTNGVDTNKQLSGAEFMSLAEFIRYREQNSLEFQTAYIQLTLQPEEFVIESSNQLPELSSSVSPYEDWVIQLYAPDMLARFGSLNIVEKGLLPTGMVRILRESRFEWDG